MHRPRRAMRDDGADQSLSEILHLRDYWRTVRKRTWTLVSAFLLIVGLATVITLLAQPVYQASASLQIDPPPQTYGGLSALGQSESGQYLVQQEYYKTQHKKLWSRVQARAVYDRLGLAEQPEFEDEDEPIEKLRAWVTIEPDQKSRITWIYVEAPSALMAEEIARAWTEVFVQRNMDEINKGVQDGLAWLKGELDKAAQELRDAETQLHDYRVLHNEIALSTEEKGNILSQQLEELSRKQALAQAERAERQAESENLASAVRKEQDTVRMSLLVSTDLMTRLREGFTDVQAEREALAVRYLPGAKPMVELDAQLSGIDQQIRAEVQAELGRRRAALAEAQGKETELQATIERVTAEALASSGGESDYKLLVRNREARAAIYQQLIDRMQEIGVTASLKENNVRIIDPSEAKEDPVEPNYVRNIGVAILAGLLAGVSLALFFDYMDTTIKTREEVEELGIPFLGIIPSVPGLAGDGWEVARERYLYAMNYPKSAFAEFCRNIRTTINFSAREDGKPPRRLLITSAGPREGKTTSSINLGITFAANGRRVCLVDADLRRPSLHHAFGMGNELGFSSLIRGEGTPDQVIQPTPQEGLFVVGSGPRPSNPAEMLGSPECRAALDTLNEHFDLVIIDSPPVVAVTDAVVLSADVDGVVVVVKSFKVARDLVLQAKRMLTDVDARLVGVILNDFDIQRKSYGYYYYYTYYGAEREDVGKRSRAPRA